MNPDDIVDDARSNEPSEDEHNPHIFGGLILMQLALDHFLFKDELIEQLTRLVHGLIEDENTSYRIMLRAAEHPGPDGTLENYLNIEIHGPNLPALWHQIYFGLLTDTVWAERLFSCLTVVSSIDQFESYDLLMSHTECPDTLAH